MRILTTILLCGTAAFAADLKLPKADAVLDRYIEVTGGKANYEKVTTEFATGSVEFVGKNIKGTLTMYRSMPANMKMVMEIAGLGKIEDGVTDGIAWSKSAIQGPRIKDSEEKATALRAASINAEVNWRDHYEKVENEALDLVEGRPVYRIKMTPKEGQVTTRFYAKDSGLLVRTKGKTKSPMGSFDVETTVGDYRKEGGLIVPHQMRQKVAGQELLMVFDNIKFNAPIPEGALVTPEEIKTLAANPPAAAPGTTPAPVAPPK